MTDTTHKEWPMAIRREPISIIPTEPRLNEGDFVLCTHIGKPKHADIPACLKNFFQYKNGCGEKTTRTPIVVMDDESYHQALTAARHLLLAEKSQPSIHSFTVVPVDNINELALLQDNVHFLRNNGIHGIALLKEGERLDLIQVGKII